MLHTQDNKERIQLNFILLKLRTGLKGANRVPEAAVGKHCLIEFGSNSRKIVILPNPDLWKNMN